jgi:hypothetical protein
VSRGEIWLKFALATQLLASCKFASADVSPIFCAPWFLLMDYRLRKAPLRPFVNSILIGALSHPANKVTVETKPLPWVFSIKAQCEKVCSVHPRERPINSIVSRNSAAASGCQLRLLSFDKDYQWAVAAAVVTVSKRREHKQSAQSINLSGKYASEAQAIKTESRVVDGIEMDQRVADSSRKMASNSGMATGHVDVLLQVGATPLAVSPSLP